MKFYCFLLLLCAFLLSPINGYIADTDYYGMGELNPNNVNPGVTNNNRGLYAFQFNGGSGSFTFQVISTLQAIGSVTLNGPVKCYSKLTGNINIQSAQCANNQGPVLHVLGKGRKVDPNNQDTTLQYFTGTITLSANEQQMLFNQELYIQVTLLSTGSDGKTQVETPTLRCPVYPYDNTGTTVYGWLNFGPNTGSFPGQTKSSSKANGFGYLSHDVTSNPPTMVYYIFHTIKTPGALLMKCAGNSLTLTSTGSNPFVNTFTFPTGSEGLALELLIKKECFLFITSSEFTSGDLFSWITPAGTLSLNMNGATESPAVTSAYYAASIVTFDYGTKQLDILTKTNLTTASITGATVNRPDNSVLCNLQQTTNPLPSRSFCIMNETDISNLENGKLYVNIMTTQNPSGELRGNLQFNSKISSSSSMSNSTKVGLGVGLGIGIPVAIALIVGGVFLAKRGTGSRGKI